MLSSVNTESIKTENFHSIALPTEVPTLLPNFTPTPKCLVQFSTSERGPEFHLVPVRPGWEIKLNRHNLSSADSCIGGDCRPRPWTPVLVMSNKKMKSLPAGINDPGSRGSRRGKLYRKLCLHILFILNICMNSGKQSNNNKALISQPKSPFPTLRV